ncbi:RICIN domain-containing protein [Actinokineospora globicatena]|uniref:RICIN domain-containing protein n=1 Tax=Actinokineospora globicatena TaxID=103729 RepID=UPI0020A51A02|nr:RICIN domain-containing protein [Actinokineospora globicatena]MCP2303973.1 Ricin-type beta-trefoil lectin domain [Actinokineospora globicatena]GLW78865.1 hypothetical protein Aglo01_33470 [Actinokineospora globicatena]GLW86722.1 hypothetical protein Aglo02_43610 [Actinokineospora globicatena]
MRHRIAALLALVLATTATPAHADATLYRYGPYSTRWTPQVGAALCLTFAVDQTEGLAVTEVCADDKTRQEWLFTQDNDGRGFVVQNVRTEQCLRTRADTERVVQARCDRAARDQYWTVATRDAGKTTSLCAADGRCLTALDVVTPQGYRQVALRATTPALQSRQAWTLAATSLG